VRWPINLPNHVENGTRLPVLGCRFLGPFVGFFEGIQGTTGLYAVESRKAGDRSFRPSADISQQTFLVLFAKHENVREKHDSEGLIQYFPRLRETGNRVKIGLDISPRHGKILDYIIGRNLKIGNKN